MTETLITSRSPQNPEVVCASVRPTEPSDIPQIVATVREHQQKYWGASPLERSAALFRVAVLLEERSDRFVDAIVAEVAKPRSEAEGEVQRALALAKYYSQVVLRANGQVYPAPHGGRLLHERRPHGVAGIITPWNFPFAIPMWKLLPALAAGNGALIKPSSQAVGTAELFAEVFEEAMPGLVKVIPGGAAVATAMINAVDVVSFTGSTAVGQSVVQAAAARGLPVQAEMGGHNAAIVLDDADVHAAARDLAYASMGYSGQKCTATRRAILVGPPQHRVKVQEAIVAAVNALTVGDPDELEVSLGPLIDAQSKEKMEQAIAEAINSGGEVIAGGSTRTTKVPIVLPTVICGLDASHPISQNETFAPILIIQEADDDDEALALANGTEYGLVASVHGADNSRINRIVAGLDTGMIKVNSPTTGVDFFAPFGGEGASSYGQREQGTLALEFYSSPRTITFAGES